MKNSRAGKLIFISWMESRGEVYDVMIPFFFFFSLVIFSLRGHGIGRTIYGWEWIGSDKNEVGKDSTKDGQARAGRSGLYTYGTYMIKFCYSY